MRGKHSKEGDFCKFVYLITIILILVVLILGYKYLKIDKKELKQEKEIITISDIVNEKTVENEKLVLKSNFEENREKKIIYIFEENILLEIRNLEIYINEDEYNIQKESINNKAGMELIETNDSEFIIYYKRLNLGTDEGLSYKEIYDKYMGIIGAYEVIK